MKTLSGPGEVSFVGDGNECTQMPEIHAAILLQEFGSEVSRVGPRRARPT